MAQSVIERLVSTNPHMEVWWDTSPLIFPNWVEKMVAAAPAARKDELRAQLERLFVVSDPARSIFRGCTTNPPLSLQAVQANPAFWNERIAALMAENPGIDRKALTWLVYKEVIRRGAEMFRPMWDASNGRYGWVSGQLDPRLFTEREIMYQQADEIAAIGPNVMVKVPASKEGVDVVRYLTSKAISTNTTTCFTLPQIMGVARAAREGLVIATKNKVDMSKWRAVITHMMGRLSERKELAAEAEYFGVDWTDADRKWFGIAVFKRAYQILRDGGYPSKLLMCSVRPGPLVNGRNRFWDVEEFAGGDIVYTLPPYGLEPLFNHDADLEFCPEAIDRPVPASTLEKMKRIAYCIQSYDPNGLSLEQFNTHPATLYTVAEFSRAANGLEEYVGARMAAAEAAGR
jgi:transaldolase